MGLKQRGSLGLCTHLFLGLLLLGLVPGSCQLVCNGAAPPQACQANDCQAVGFMVFGAEGKYWTGTYAHSASLRKLSFFTPPTQGLWTGSVDSGVKVTRSEGGVNSFDIECRSRGIVIGDLTLYTPTPEDISRALGSALSSGSVDDFSY